MVSMSFVRIVTKSFCTLMYNIQIILRHQNDGVPKGVFADYSAEAILYKSKYKENKMTRENVLKLLEDKRIRPMVYTRVMGYHRPVESFNKGKLGEHRQRLYFRGNIG